MPLHDVGYRAWEGVRVRGGSAAVIAGTGLKLAWKSHWLRRAVIFAWSPALFFAVAFFAFEQAVEQGRVGPVGAGHYAKMIHNGIEYGMMQSFAEGFEILKTSPFPFDLAALAELWNRGSVVRSWLLELAARGLREDATLDGIKGFVPDSGEGRWTVQASIDQDVPAPVLTLSLQMRFRSRQAESFGAKVLAMLRNQFGGLAVKKA